MLNSFRLFLLTSQTLCGCRFFPNQGADEKLEMSEVLKLLDKHIKNSYSTLKNAFLELDKARKAVSFFFSLKNKWPSSNKFAELILFVGCDNVNRNCPGG